MHYLTGHTFSGWVREAGLQAGEQIRMKKEGGRVLIQRVPADRKVNSGEMGAGGKPGALNACSLAISAQPVCFSAASLHHSTMQIKADYTTKATSRSLSVGGGALGAVAGAPEGAGQELASPPPADALEALDALVAAAGYAGAHGTPAIQAALAGAAGAAAAAAIAAAGLPAGGGLSGVEALLQQGLDTAGLAALPQFKRRRTNAAELQLLEQQALAARRSSGAAGWAAGGFQLQQGEAAVDAPASLASWQPSHPHVLMLRAINQVLEGHPWSAEEQTDCLRFRWAVSESIGQVLAIGHGWYEISAKRHAKSAMRTFPWAPPHAVQGACSAPQGQVCLAGRLRAGDGVRGGAAPDGRQARPAGVPAGGGTGHPSPAAIQQYSHSHAAWCSSTWPGCHAPLSRRQRCCAWQCCPAGRGSRLGRGGRHTYGDEAPPRACCRCSRQRSC